MRPLRAAVLLLPFATAAAACSLLTDLSGLTTDAAPSDASADGAGSADGRPPPPADAGGEAATDGAPAESGADAAPMCPPLALPATCAPKYLGDAMNCCVAGRDCQGGACVNGKCQPVVLVADATTDARGIAVAGDWLVWATGCTGVVRRVTKTGTGNAPLPAGKSCTPTLAATASQVYWIEYDGPNLNTTPIDGSGSVVTVATVPGDAGVRANFARLAIDANNAYWAMQVPPSIWYAPLSGAKDGPTALANAGSTKETVAMPYGVAVDGSHVYWSDKDGNAIKRRALSSLGQDVLAEPFATSSAPGELALDATTVYWVDDNGEVSAHPKDGGAVTILASGQRSPESLVVDDRYVYWTSYVPSGTVSRVPKTGGAVEVLATGQAYPYSITQDCGAVYFTNQADFKTGQIVKIVK
jgi:hypothetical protein